METTKEYLTQEMAVFHCKTEKISISLLKIADSLGLEWCNSVSYLDINYWYDYRDETCYNFRCGTHADSYKYNSHGYTIIDASKLIAKHKIELFNGDN